MSEAISERLGVTIRTLKDRASIEEDVENFALQKITERVGYEIRTIRDPEKLKEDFARIALSVISEKLGIPIGAVEPGPLDIEDIKGRVLAWAEAELMTKTQAGALKLAGDLTRNADIVAIANSLNSRLAVSGSHESITVSQLAVKVAAQMATEAVAGLQKVATVSVKKSRRRESLRAAQAKFRRTHGNRQKYVPLGMQATIG